MVTLTIYPDGIMWGATCITRNKMITKAAMRLAQGLPASKKGLIKALWSMGVSVPFSDLRLEIGGN
jgi:hypothetical protein